jgi:hypothetical protein
MKFLCRNCKAKYQIADEKVAGRTLRMTCQQCGEPIVVRSPSRGSQASRPIAPLASVSAEPPSALGADFQRQISGPLRELAAPPPQDEWHVAIHDVPVGPMRRDEVARKIAVHAVDRESLAWREGMDDWLPIKHIPELAALFPGVAPPPASVPGVSHVQGAPPRSVVPAPAPPIAAPLPVPPAARVDMAPVGARQVMSLDDYSAQVEAEPAVAVQQLASEPAAAPAKPLGWAPMFVLVSGGAFILAMGALLGVRVLAPQQAAPAPAPVAAPTQPVAVANPEPAHAEPQRNNVVELDTQSIEGQSGTTRRNPATGASAGTADKKKELTAEEKEMLARMGGGLDRGPSIKAPSESSRPSGGGQGQLTAQQLSEVVLRGRKNLQRCYETALRGSGTGDAVRLDVEIEVSPNGNVTLVKASGKGLPGMDDCITRTVKMWRFPTSGEVTQTRFPVVFQPGA